MTMKRREVRVKPKTCRPTKAELEEPFVVRKADGTMPTPGEPVRVARAPAKVTGDPEV